MRVSPKKNVLEWALEGSDLSTEELDKSFPKFHEWMDGKVKPTLKELEKFAKAVYLPIGCLLASKPMQDKLPIQDFRTIGSSPIARPSRNLLDTIYSCQERQEWYREFAQATRQPELEFIGSLTKKDKPEDAAAQIRSRLELDSAQDDPLKTAHNSLGNLIKKADEAGILVMINGVVKNNTHRKLNPQEFRGFALADRLAPLIFINGSDFKAAQIFTLAHELAHLWLDSSGVSKTYISPTDPPKYSAEEKWCNAVAAELLVPLARLQEALQEGMAVNILAKKFSVSKLVILRRLYDAKSLNHTDFQQAWNDEHNILEIAQKKEKPKGGGGNFYSTTKQRLGPRFARALITSTLEGKTLYRDAFRMIGSRKTDTLHTLGKHIEDTHS